MYKKLLSDFSPGVNLACAPLQLGLDNTRTAWASGLNVEIFSQKGICRQNGNRRITTSPDNVGINSLFSFCPNDDPTKQKILYSTVEGDFYEFDCTYKTHKLMKTGLKTNQPCFYALYIGGVAVANGADEPFFYEGENSDNNWVSSIKPMNTVAKDGESPIIAEAICAYKSRLWLACGDTLYFSGIGLYDDWETACDAGYISNFHCDSAPVTALMPYKDYLAIYKKNQVYLLTGSSYDDFAIVPFANKGAGAQNSVVTSGNKQYFFADALFNLEQTGLLAQIALGAEASIPIKPALTGTTISLKTLTGTYSPEGEKPQTKTFLAGTPFNKARANCVCAIGYERKNQIWFYVPTQNNEYINNVWIYDCLNNAWTLRAVPQPILCAANYGDYIISGTQDGRILLEDSGSDFDGDAIVFEWKSPFLTLGYPNSRKLIDQFYFLVSDAIDNNFLFSAYKDYDTTDAQDHEHIEVSNRLNLVWGSDSKDGDAFLWADENSEDTEGSESGGETISGSGSISGEPAPNSDLNANDSAVVHEQRWAIPCETAQKAEISGSCLSVQFCIEGNLPEHNFALLALEYKEISPD